MQPGLLDPSRFEGRVQGRDVRLITLKSDRLQASWCNHGARLLQLCVPDRMGVWRDVVLGYDHLQQMLDGMPSMGAFVGRFANRIGNSSFIYRGQQFHLPANDGLHCLHGGPGGSRHQVFEILDLNPNQVVMAWRFLSSVDGFPGDVELKVAYALHGATMTVEYQAEVKLQPTPLNFTVHPFFNLNGDPQQSILNHRLEIFSEHFLPVDRQRIPLGHFESVRDTPFDFRSPKTIGQSLRQSHEQLGLGVSPGFDHAWLTPSDPDELQLQARLSSDASGIGMEVWSDAPSIQFYSGMAMDGSLPRHAGKHGAVYGPCAGLCLEPQHLPDTPNHPEFGSCVHQPGAVIAGRIEFRFSASGV
jgi:aldose 1-epimerase